MNASWPHHIVQPYCDHGHLSSQATARPQSGRQADRGFFYRGGRGSAPASRDPSLRVCLVGWLEGRPGACSEANSRTTARDSSARGQETLEIKQRKFLTRPHPLTGDRLLSRGHCGKQPEVTVCIAALSENIVVGASDRMLTSGDVQFETSAGTKIFGLSNSIFVMTAGDAALQGEIVQMVSREMTNRIACKPQNQWKVSEAADLYVKYYNFVRNKRAESQILSPLHLDYQSYLANQRTMSDQLVNDLAKELLNFEIPNVAAIFAGLDPTGAHIYTVRNNGAECDDNVGFAAIGIGSRHASSQFMFARHAWNSPFSETLLLTYYVKREAEVAPGVGIGTDMVVVGSQVGPIIPLGGRVIKELDKEYRKIIRAESNAFTRAKGAMRNYVEELTKQTKAAAAPGGQQAPANNGGTPSSDESKSETEPPKKET